MGRLRTQQPPAGPASVKVPKGATRTAGQLEPHYSSSSSDAASRLSGQRIFQPELILARSSPVQKFIARRTACQESSPKIFTGWLPKPTSVKHVADPSGEIIGGMMQRRTSCSFPSGSTAIHLRSAMHVEMIVIVLFSLWLTHPCTGAYFHIVAIDQPRAWLAQSSIAGALSQSAFFCRPFVLCLHRPRRHRPCIAGR